MLDIIPEKWTPEVVISRHQGLLGNIEDELEIGRTVALIGEKKSKRLNVVSSQRSKDQIRSKN